MTIPKKAAAKTTVKASKTKATKAQLVPPPFNPRMIQFYYSTYDHGDPRAQVILPFNGTVPVGGGGPPHRPQVIAAMIEEGGYAVEITIKRSTGRG